MHPASSPHEVLIVRLPACESQGPQPVDDRPGYPQTCAPWWHGTRASFPSWSLSLQAVGSDAPPAAAARGTPWGPFSITVAPGGSVTLTNTPTTWDLKGNERAPNSTNCSPSRARPPTPVAAHRR